MKDSLTKTRLGKLVKNELKRVHKVEIEWVARQVGINRVVQKGGVIRVETM